MYRYIINTTENRDTSRAISLVALVISSLLLLLFVVVVFVLACCPSISQRLVIFRARLVKGLERIWEVFLTTVERVRVSLQEMRRFLNGDLDRAIATTEAELKEILDDGAQGRKGEERSGSTSQMDTTSAVNDMDPDID